MKTNTPLLQHSTIPVPSVRLFASGQSWIEGEAVRQLHATARLDGVRLAVGFPDLHPDLTFRPPSPIGWERGWG